MNLNGRAGWVSHGAFGCPITVHDRRRTDSYPVSLMTQYLDYPRAELNHFSSGPLRLAARFGLVAFEAILRVLWPIVPFNGTVGCSRPTPCLRGF